MQKNSFRINDSHSLFLLEKTSTENHSFVRFRQLVQSCRNDGDFLSFDNSKELLSCYASDAQSLHFKLPLVVFRPFKTQCIPSFLKACFALEIPVAVRCGGTGLSGGTVPSQQGVILLTGHLKVISDYNPEQGTLMADAGVTVQQLNRHVEEDGWHFPLSMASDGVAGIAGCLSCNARGYTQQQSHLYQGIERVSLVDGRGDILEVPSSFVLGTEGIYGVVLNMRIHLKKKPACSKVLRYRGSWKDVFGQLPALRSLQPLSYLIKTEDSFHFGLQGEAWRISCAISFLQKYFIELEPENQLPSSLLMPKRRHFILCSSAFISDDLPEASASALNMANGLDLEYSYIADVLSGALHICLQSNDDGHLFAQKIEEFLVRWSDFVDHKKGTLQSCHGVGMQMSPFMTPFWGEETQSFWKRLKCAFDPKDIFGRGRFFPQIGKCLEKQCHSD